MKKIITSLLALCIISFSTVSSAPTIVDYNKSHKNDVVEIAFQDPYKFFGSSHLVRQKKMTPEQFESDNRASLDAALNETLRVKKVLIADDGTAIGLISFSKKQEQSLESLKRTIEARGLPFDEASVLALMPYIKKTDAESEFAFIEALAVSKEYRGKGYGKMLTEEAERAIAQQWPALTKIKLTVYEDNGVARKLYEAAGYKVAANQPTGMAMMKAVQYEKSL